MPFIRQPLATPHSNSSAPAPSQSHGLQVSQRAGVPAYQKPPYQPVYVPQSSPPVIVETPSGPQVVYVQIPEPEPIFVPNPSPCTRYPTALEPNPAYYDYYFHNRMPGDARSVVDYGSSMYDEAKMLNPTIGAVAHLAGAMCQGALCDRATRAVATVGSYLDDLAAKASDIISDGSSSSSSSGPGYTVTGDFNSLPDILKRAVIADEQRKAAQSQPDPRYAQAATTIAPTFHPALTVATRAPHGMPALDLSRWTAYGLTHAMRHDSRGWPLETGIEGLPRNVLSR